MTSGRQGAETDTEPQQHLSTSMSIKVCFGKYYPPTLQLLSTVMDVSAQMREENVNMEELVITPDPKPQYVHVCPLAHG